MSEALRKPNQGILQLVLHRVGTRTAIKDCFYHVPLQVLRPVYLDDTGMAYIYLLNPCGGVVGGDTFNMSVTLEPDAHAYVTTPSATKLYGTIGLPAQQHMVFTLQAGSVLVYMPQQTIPFANAAFHQQIIVRLAPGSCAFLGDILAPGRVARGECFAYREFDSRLRVENANGDVILVDRTRLQPTGQPLDGLGLFEGYPYLGTFYALGADPSLLAPLSDQLHAMLACRQQLLCSATELACGGVAVRVLGEDHRGVSQALYDVWDRVRQHLFGYPAVACRT